MNISPISYRRTIQTLMQEAASHNVPTAAEESAWIKSAKRGDMRATHNLVLGHLRLVIKIAHQMAKGWNADLEEELVAAGIAGMIESIGQYRASSQHQGRFMHYAVFHIRRQMRRALNDFRTPVSANPNNYDLARKIFAYEETILREQNRRPSHEEIGKHFGLTPNRVERTKKLMESPMYLDHTASSDDERTGHDICADSSSPSPALATEIQMEKEMLESIMQAHLTEREVAILRRRFGYEGGAEQDLSVIGDAFNLSRERVRQIEAQALKKLRFHLSQQCTTYRARAQKVAGVHPAILSSELPVFRLPVESAPVAAKRTSGVCRATIVKGSAPAKRSSRAA
jgi:RNA polymerase primary sigma factor